MAFMDCCLRRSFTHGPPQAEGHVPRWDGVEHTVPRCGGHCVASPGDESMSRFRPAVVRSVRLGPTRDNALLHGP
eukprot:365725-Chlamydomonas_euryale.AAC.32